MDWDDHLTHNFTLGEFVMSQTAIRKGIDNHPPTAALGNLRELAEFLELIRRDVLRGLPMRISSGYRCAALNAAVGGSEFSAHLDGHAADFTCMGFGSPLKVAKAIEASPHFARVDQLIHEFGRWVHVSIAPARRGELLTIGKGRKMHGLHPL